MKLKLKLYLALTIGDLQTQDAPLAGALIGELGKRNVTLDENEPIGANVMVRQLIEEGRLEQLVGLCALSEADSAKLLGASSIDALDEAQLTKDFSAASAATVGKMIERYFVCEENVDLAVAFGQLAGALSNASMAVKPVSYWQTSLPGKITVDKLPAGSTYATAAEAIARRLEILYPGWAILGRIAPIVDSLQKTALDALVVLEAKNPARFAGTFADLDVSGVASNTLPTLEMHWNQLLKMVRCYPGLGLEQVFDNYTQTTGVRFTEMSTRVSKFVTAISSASENSARFDPLSLDLSKGSKEWSRFNLTTYADNLKSTIRAYQRMRVVGKNIDVAAQLLAAGHSSALSIARRPKQDIQALPGLAGTKGEQIWETARQLATDAGLFVAGVSDVIGGAFDPLPTRPVPSVGQSLAALDGFASLFGNQSYCDCAHCASILGPAAYFVDLMDFVKHEVASQVPTSSPSSLKSRRPDLWTFPLTCSATTALVPTLDIVNEVLENAIATSGGYAGSFADRPAVEDAVYQGAGGLPGRTASFAQPFALGLARTSALLDAFSIDRPALAAAVGAPANRVSRITLGISTAVEALLTTPRTTKASLEAVYGLTFPAFPTHDGDTEASVLAAKMGLDRAGLGEVVTSWFVRQGAATPTIELKLRSTDSIQNDVEWVNGLTIATLDRMHRLARLARVTGLAVPHLDRLLKIQGDTSLGSLEQIAHLRALTVRVGASFSEDDDASLAGPLDAAGLARFNRGVRSPDDAWPPPASQPAKSRFIHPGLTTSGVTAGGGAAVRLASALGLTDGATLALIRYLAPHLAQEATAGFDPANPDEAQRYFLLSVANLSLLDRHARLTRLFGVSADELVRLMDLAGLAQVVELAGAVALGQAVDAWRASGRTLDALVAATGGTPRPGTLLDVTAAASSIRAQAATALVVTDTLFATALGMSTADAQTLLDDNAGLFVVIDGKRYIVVGDVTGADVTVPAGLEVVVDGATRGLAAADVVGALAPHTARALLVQGVAIATGRDPAEVEQLIALAGFDIDGQMAKSMRDAVSGSELEGALAAVAPVDVATRGWSAAGLAQLVSSPVLFGPGAWPALDPSQPVPPTFTFTQATVLGRAAARGTGPDRQDALLAVAAHFDPVTATFAAAGDADLAAFLGTTPVTIAGLRGAAALPAGLTAALDRMAALVALADRLGVDGGALKGLVSDVDSERAAAAAAIEHAAELRAERDTTEATRLADARNLVREQKRDALVDYLTHGAVAPATAPAFASHAALAGYYLIDVDAGGCATTSRVVAATNAVQEYINRIILGVELTAASVAVTLSDAALRSWEWRRAYRMWEANRKVFLWPENYLEPGLRDDKTHLFTQLEDALGQSELDEGSILSAYATYLQGLDELASLKVAGAYHDIAADGSSDVLHLIGVTPSDPATFYYRSVSDLQSILTNPTKSVVWGNWQKLDLSIPSRFVSPVVYEGRLHLLWTTMRTSPAQSLLAGGVLKFSGYKHTLGIEMSTLQPNGAWSGSQTLEISSSNHERDGFVPDVGMVFDEVSDDAVRLPRLQSQTVPVHLDPLDGYSLRDATWRSVWPSVGVNGMGIVYRNFRVHGTIDLFERRVTSLGWGASPSPRRLVACDGLRLFLAPLPTSLHLIWRYVHGECIANVLIDRPRVWGVISDIDLAATAHSPGNDLVGETYTGPAATLFSQPEALAIPGAPHNAIVQVAGDVLLWQDVEAQDKYLVRRLGTTVVKGLARTLFQDGIDGLIATSKQLSMAESALPMLVHTSNVAGDPAVGSLNFQGPVGIYLRELFFHIPMLIATALAGRGRHADARRWFQRVFDPTSTEQIDTTGAPPAEVAHRQLDRVWRYREFRELTVDRVRDVLTDGAALDAYRADPFNPHAIARRRVSAYQRNTFGRYVDNLLEWGDLLFSQFTRESVEEARSLYQLAAQLLGERPARLGDCDEGEGEAAPRTYASIEPALSTGDAARRAAESEVMAKRSALPAAPVSTAVPVLASVSRLTRARQSPWVAPAAASKPTSFGRKWLQGRTGAWAPSKAVGAVDGPLGLGGRVGSPARAATDDSLASSVLAQLGSGFCVPVNKSLLARWDRVEDRLWKIHHCLDIEGVRRDLALFAPELDPMTRVQATALGLTPDDFGGESPDDVPPYRFAYLIERAKGFASSLAGFGGALLGALERRDNETLSRLRQEQGLAMARLTRQQRVWDIEMAQEGLFALERQIQSAEFRRDYQDSLLREGISSDEDSDLTKRRMAGPYRRTSVGSSLASSLVSILPEFNHPWSVSFGGRELSSVASGLANWFSGQASMLEADASISATQANYQRRSQGWRHQLQLTKDELASMARQRQAAALRVKAAEQSLVAYDESIQQLEDALAFEKDRVTNLALHTRLAQQLKLLYRLAYGHALALARLAERAYRYERGDVGPSLAPTYWDASMGGLLAGEHLLSDLQALDRRFLETNHRELEIDQPFALSQLDPAALLQLRQHGTCQIAVPEMAFDVSYPGHYKRRLRAVRLTIPCVTGPYVNVGATLTLLSSQVRPTATAALAPVPLAHGTTIATSTAQADGGVFELSFRDERYLPFEGQGAVSEWQLELPSTVRPFDYGSITDVVISLAYSAKADPVRRAALEDTADGEESILHHYRTTETTRIISLREELGATFLRLVRSAAASPVGLRADRRDAGAGLPRPRTNLVTASIGLRLAKGVSPGALAISLDGSATGAFTANAALGGLYAAPIAAWSASTWTGAHTLTLTAPGGLGGDPDTLDPAKVLDILLVTTVKLA
ncbi:MAG: neuraminidase-like domain-containing protein [Kofleriaceae bacterium]